MGELSSNTLAIREARPEDLFALLRVQTDSLRTLCIHDYSSEQLEALVNRNIQHASYGGCQQEITLVAESEQVIIGFASLLGSYVSAVYVHPYHVRHGIGSSLLQAIERLAWQRGVQTIRVAASLTAQQFYQQNGYQVRTFSNLKSQGSIRIPIINMQKRLTSA